MKRKLMMLIATVVMVGGLTACGGGASDTNTKPMDTDKGIENGVAVDSTEDVEETAPVVESEPIVEDIIPVIEDKPAFTTFEIRDIEYYSAPNDARPFYIADGEPIDINETIANVMFRIPEGYELDWEDLESVKERIAKNGYTNGDKPVEGHVLTYTEYPGSAGWDYYVECYYEDLSFAVEDARENEFYSINLTEEEFKNLYIEFITNYSIKDMIDMFDIDGEVSKGEEMSAEAKKFLPLNVLVAYYNYNSESNYDENLELYEKSPEVFEFVNSNK